MVGVSCPSIMGLTKEEFVETMEIFGERIKNLSGLLITNYNPTVEMRRSSEVLIYGLYKLFNKISL